MTATMINYYPETPVEFRFKIPAAISEYVFEATVTGKPVSFSERVYGSDRDSEEEIRLKKQITSAVLGAAGRFGLYQSRTGWITGWNPLGCVQVVSDAFEGLTFFPLISSSIAETMFRETYVTGAQKLEYGPPIRMWTLYRMTQKFDISQYKTLKEQWLANIRSHGFGNKPKNIQQ